MVDPATDVGFVCEHIIMFTEAQANALHANGWSDLTDFEGYDMASLESWMKSTARLTNARGGCSFPLVRSKRLCALAYWVNRRLLHGLGVFVADFDNIELAAALNDYPIYDMQRDADEAGDKPETFNYEKWEDRQDSVITYLRGRKNITKNVPLYYVIRPIAPPAALTEDEEIIFHAPHVGAAFVRDNKEVHQLLTELTNGTDADEWIKQHRRAQNGRQAWLDLCNHYDGPAEGDKRVTVARNNIKVIHYKNESSFSFEKYSTKLKKSFTTLEKYAQPKSEREKVEILLDQINTNDQRLVTAIGICRNSHARTFESACTYLSQQIAIIFPQHQPNAFGRKKGGKRPTVRNIHAIKSGKNGKVTCNGVDLSDTTRYFMEKEFQKIGKEGRDYLNKCPKRKAAKESHRANKKKKGGNSEDGNRLVAAVINGVMNASRHESQSVADSSIPSQITPRQPQHGPHARQAAAAQTSNNSTRSTVTYDHNGNVVDSP